MKHKILYAALLSVLASCNSSDKVEHRGEIMPTMKVAELDSLVVPIDRLSGNGNYLILVFILQIHSWVVFRDLVLKTVIWCLRI